MGTDNWLTVDRAGLGKLLERKGSAWVLFELIQNALDEDAKKVSVHLVSTVRRGRALLQVTDDSPNGWVDLRHAYTMFAPSWKKGDPEKRGRFNLGEKLVLAVCESATVKTMDGSVYFKEDGTRTRSGRHKEDRGTFFEAVLKFTNAQVNEALAAIPLLLPPDGVTVTVNGVEVERRKPLASLWVTLPTEAEGEGGVLRKTSRRCLVEIVEPLLEERGHLYEGGVPVVETGDRWHVNVHQKVPLNFDRDNVPPAFLRKVRAAVLNEMAGKLEDEDAAEPWVQEAASSPEVEPDAFATVLDKVHGVNRVMRDPSDREANSTAFSHGWTVVSGNQLSPGMRENLKRFRADGRDTLPPAGQRFPTPKPYSEDGEPVKHAVVDGFMRGVEKYAKAVGKALTGITPEVSFVLAPNFGAAYGPGSLDFSVQRLGRAFFRRACETMAGLEDLDDLLCHEFAHHRVVDHLSHEFHAAVSRNAAKLAAVCRTEGGSFRPYPDGALE